MVKSKPSKKEKKDKKIRAKKKKKPAYTPDITDGLAEIVIRDVCEDDEVEELEELIESDKDYKGGQWASIIADSITSFLEEEEDDNDEDDED